MLVVERSLVLGNTFSFIPIGINVNALLWGLISTLLMYLGPACVAFAVIAFARYKEIQAAKVMVFPSPARPEGKKPEEKETKEGPRRAA